MSSIPQVVSEETPNRCEKQEALTGLSPKLTRDVPLMLASATQHRPTALEHLRDYLERHRASIERYGWKYATMIYNPNNLRGVIRLSNHNTNRIQSLIDMAKYYGIDTEGWKVALTDITYNWNDTTNNDSSAFTDLSPGVNDRGLQNHYFSKQVVIR